jgi:hypothetical protein
VTATSVEPTRLLRVDESDFNEIADAKDSKLWKNVARTQAEGIKKLGVVPPGG